MPSILKVSIKLALHKFDYMNVYIDTYSQNMNNG